MAVYEIAISVEKTVYVQIEATSDMEAFEIYLKKVHDQSPLVTDDSDIKIIDGKDYGGYISTSINGSTIDEE